MEKLRLEEVRIQANLTLERDRLQEQSSRRHSLNPSAGNHADIACNLRLLTKISEKDLDTFFVLFERLAKTCKWPENDQIVMPQSVLAGKAQDNVMQLEPILMRNCVI